MIKNTLFRFISMRAPEHLEKKEVDLRFVRHPDPSHANNYFLNAITGVADKSLRHVVNTTAANFSATAWQTREDVKNTVAPELYDFAIWLSSNRSTFTLEELDEFPSIDPILNTSVLLQLWDNLFYQIVTFKSGYVREAILSVLVADHFLKNKSYVHGLKELRKLAQARVIIPKEPFGLVAIPSKQTAFVKKLDDLPINTRFLDVSMRRAVAKTRISDLKKVADEMKLVQSDYEKRNSKALKAAQRTHAVVVADAYKNATPKIETYIDKETGLTKTIKSYPDLELSAFSFNALEQLDDIYLEKRLSESSFAFIKELKGNGLAGTFQDVSDIIQNAIQEETNVIFAHSNLRTVGYLEQQTPSSTGVDPTGTGTGDGSDIYNSGNYLGGSGSTGVGPNQGTGTITTPVIPVFNIYSTGIIGTPSSLQLVIGGMPVGLDVIGAEYRISEGTGSAPGSNIVAQGTNDFEDLWTEDNKLQVLLFKSHKIRVLYESITLDGTLLLSNGDSIIISGTCYEVMDTIAGISSKSYKGNGKFTYKQMDVKDENGDDYIDNPSIIEYIPSGFGVKRLGIADYRKVEQEVCCYVPGEVSNIENVMAREYKEKSTRRLRRSEDTTTTSKEQEKEKLTDTTTTDRFEMNREVSNMLAEDNSIGLHTNYTRNLGGGAGGQFTIGADFAHNTTKEHSDNQSVTQAKEVTERALERVVQKVKEERIVKIIEEYEETNKHGYDNREGNQHISGVYRWVDKIYNNKVVNYGKRLMYEFMIPEPAAFHNFAIAAKKIDIPVKPIDPRVGDGHVSMVTHSSIDRTNYGFWAAMYNAEVTPCPDENKYIGKSIEIAGDKNTFEKVSEEIEIPEGYFSKSFEADYIFSKDGDGGYSWSFNIGNYHRDIRDDSSPHPSISSVSGSLSPYYDKIHVGCSSINHVIASVTLSIKTVLSDEAFAKWQMETFNAIISAYEKRKAEYDEQVKELKAAIGQKVATNPLFYREIENIALKKNCIAYLADHSNMGGMNLIGDRENMEVSVKYKDERLEKYAAFVKFFEQAFEWDLMSYYFYPFYWANRTKWQEMYNIDNDDPLFRSFLQSGMALVVLTVRPGFEETVNWYMGTGQIWNGGQVTTLDDPLYLSIVEEMKELEGTVEETWESRVPTSLTVLQAGTIGLDVTGLPCNPECDEYKVLDKDGNTIPNPISQKKFQIGKSYDDNGEELPQNSGETPLEGEDPLPSV